MYPTTRPEINNPARYDQNIMYGGMWDNLTKSIKHNTKQLIRSKCEREESGLYDKLWKWKLQLRLTAVRNTLHKSTA